jgi:transketolase
MLSTNAKLVPNLFSAKLEEKSTRDGFGTGSVQAGKENPNVVVLSADLKESTRAEWFEKEFPKRFIEMGVAEQNMATVAAGLCAVGKIPFITSYAAFSPGRNWEQIRTTIALNDVPVIVCGMHAGVSVGPDGATHQMLEDMSLMRAMPNMVVINPCDAEEARKATLAAVKLGKPVYLRFGRSNVPVITTIETPFSIGSALPLYDAEHPEVAVVTTGSLAFPALMAAELLAKEGVRVSVTHFHTVKPLETRTLLALAKKAGKVLTLEEHQVAGGFGSAVAEVLSEHYPVPVKRLGLQDEFGQSGEPSELLEHYGLSAGKIADALRAFATV